MKKQGILAMAMVFGLAGSITMPVEAAKVYRIDDNGGARSCVIVNGQICKLPEGNRTLKDLCEKLQNGNWTDCPTISLPDCSQPELEEDLPEMETPNENQPESDNEVSEEENAGFSYAEQIVKLVNDKRTKAGLQALELDTEIASAALVRAKEITTSFSHTRPDGRKFSTVLTDNGIRFNGAGENIAWGQKSPEQVMDAWMNSEGHRANILNARFTKIGVGHYQDAAGRNYWVQLFTH